MFEINNDEVTTSTEKREIPEGWYELIIYNASLRKNKNNKEYISMPLVVRNDVEQVYKNAYVWHSMYRLNSPKSTDPDGFGNSFIQQISKAACLGNGTKYEGIGDWMSDLAGKTVRAEIYHDETYGVKIGHFEKSMFPECNHVWKEKAPKENPPSVQELPF